LLQDGKNSKTWVMQPDDAWPATSSPSRIIEQWLPPEELRSLV
jgi:hypothetical protein